MIKAYSLNNHEIAQAQALEEERRNLLARFGGITLEMETIRAQLPQLDQRSRALVQTVVQRAGVPEFRTARIDGANLICDLPDEPMQPETPHAGPVVDIQRVNGEAAAKR